MTEYVRPKSLDEALRLRGAHPDWTLLAGGTDLMVHELRDRPPAGVIDLFGLSGLTGVEVIDDGIWVGAATTYRMLLDEPLIAEHLPLLHAASREVGAVQIQARGTIGGNVGTSSPVGDSLPVLLAYDAHVELASAGATRIVPYRDLSIGYRKIDLAADEIIVALRFTRAGTGQRGMFRKIGTRRAQSVSKSVVAMTVIVEDGTLGQPRIGLGAVAATPVRASHVEELLAGREVGSIERSAIVAALAADIEPIDDVRSTAAYRRTVVANVLFRFVASLAP